MNLSLPEDSLLIRDMFQRFFEGESTMERVRAAEPVGFDAALWRELVALDAPCMRLSAEVGGAGMGLFDACLMMEEAGRRLASVPLAEAVAAVRLLGEVGGDTAQQWIGRVADGETVITLALQPVAADTPQWVPGAAVAKAILSFDGDSLALEEPASALEAPATLGGNALALFRSGAGKREVLASGEAARSAWAQAVELSLIPISSPRD
ncbi:acyl-CoA dehydrogenase, partial [Mangrovimicrobium sediminis]